MPAKKKWRSSFVDDEAAHSGEDSDVGAPLRNLQMNDPEGQNDLDGLQLDDQFIHDAQEVSPLGRNPIFSDEKEGQPPNKRPDRLPQNCSALAPS